MSDTAPARELADRLRAGERRALARAITLVESERPSDRAEADALLGHLDAAGEAATRIGISGAPGAGKSTFIECFGLRLIAAGHRVAVLAVDPSSAASGGAILGDKTRMPELARSPGAFIRPSPSRGGLGGVARRTREAALLCGAAGFDTVLVETVGVGQAETMVAELCDLFALLIAPVGGDELQGVKRGVVELADLVLVTKADGALAGAAERTRADYAGALALLRPRAEDAPDFPKALTVSAVAETGLDAAWAEMRALVDWRRAEGHLEARRARQARFWFERAVRDGLLARLETDPDLAGRLEVLGRAVAAGERAVEPAAAEMLAALGAHDAPP